VQPMDGWASVRDYARTLGTDGELIIRESQRRRMSPEQVEEAFGRAAAYARDPHEGAVPFTEFAARPPGFCDIRVFDQAQWWVDVMRVPHRLTELDDAYLNNLTAFLIDKAAWFRCSYMRAYPASDPGASPGSWLEGTTLMLALRREQGRRATGRAIQATDATSSRARPCDE
jgi:hypothetical protein